MSGAADIDLGGAGLGLGYRYTEQLGIELGWEYRSHDSEVLLAAASAFDEGNYASNIFYLNGHYMFKPSGRWQPHLGAGLVWMQEVDIDLEFDGAELSCSGDGDIGHQVFAGLNFELSK